MALSQDNLQRDAQDPESSGGTQEGYTTNNPFHQAPLPIQKSSDLYYRHLATKGRGSPLWIPEPSRNLPIEYQRKGITIGDVGILTDNGGFDFLFNICLPQGDPINPEEMPEDFHPLRALQTRDIINNLEFKPRSYLASASVKSSQRDKDSGLTFESSASEGAILTMPHGSLSRDLMNKTTFKKYASANVVKWYRYANEVCGREAKNGDIRLVVGVSPATAWGMATFANLSEQSGFLLRFKPTEAHSLGPPSYGWEYSGTAEVKSGPHTEEIETLRKMEREAGLEGSDEYENQTLFVRTINVTIQANKWNELSAGWEELYLDDGFNDSPTNKRDHSFNTPNLPTNSAGAGSGLGYRGMPSGNKPDDHGSPTLKKHKRAQSVYLSELPSAIASHPSSLINKLLLDLKPNSYLAVTEDDDWIAAIRKSDKVLPPSDELFSRMTETHRICEEEGIVCFRPKAYNDDMDALSYRLTTTSLKATRLKSEAKLPVQFIDTDAPKIRLRQPDPPTPRSTRYDTAPHTGGPHPSQKQPSYPPQSSYRYNFNSDYSLNYPAPVPAAGYSAQTSLRRYATQLPSNRPPSSNYPSAFNAGDATPPVSGFNVGNAVATPPVGGFNLGYPTPPVSGFNPGYPTPPVGGFNAYAGYASPPMGGINTGYPYLSTGGFNPDNPTPPVSGLSANYVYRPAGGINVNHDIPADGFPPRQDPFSVPYPYRSDAQNFARPHPPDNSAHGPGSYRPEQSGGFFPGPRPPIY